MNGITILIPVYNEEKVIQQTIAGIDKALKKSSISEYEIIAINDGSSDKTWERLQSCPAECKLLNHKRNRGYGASLKTGLRSAKYSTIVITDADGTYPNEKIPELVNYYFDNSLDMLVGARTGTNVSYPFIKKIPKFFIKGLASYISGVKIPDINSEGYAFLTRKSRWFFTTFSRTAFPSLRRSLWECFATSTRLSFSKSIITNVSGNQKSNRLKIH